MIDGSLRAKRLIAHCQFDPVNPNFFFQRHGVNLVSLLHGDHRIDTNRGLCGFVDDLTTTKLIA